MITLVRVRSHGMAEKRPHIFLLVAGAKNRLRNLKKHGSFDWFELGRQLDTLWDLCKATSQAWYYGYEKAKNRKISEKYLQ